MLSSVMEESNPQHNAVNNHLGVGWMGFHHKGKRFRAGYLSTSLFERLHQLRLCVLRKQRSRFAVERHRLKSPPHNGGSARTI